MLLRWIQAGAKWATLRSAIAALLIALQLCGSMVEPHALRADTAATCSPAARPAHFPRHASVVHPCVPADGGLSGCLMPCCRQSTLAAAPLVFRQTAVQKHFRSLACFPAACSCAVPPDQTIREAAPGSAAQAADQESPAAPPDIVHYTVAAAQFPALLGIPEEDAPPPDRCSGLSPPLV